MSQTSINAVSIPTESTLLHFYQSVNLADAFAVTLPQGSSTNPEVLGRFIFSHQPAWIGALMKVRDTIVSLFGLKTAKALALDNRSTRRIGFFRVYSVGEREVILGEDDNHLDFRLSLLCSEVAGATQLTMTTVVHCHNLLGRLYIFIISPFHRAVVKASLRRAAERGWPRAGQ